MRLYRIIKKQIVTEKSSNTEMLNSCYVAEVSRDATKIDVKKAVLDLYWLEVSSVNILNTREKFKQGKKWMQVRKRISKKAYITLRDKKAKLDFSIIK